MLYVYQFHSRQRQRCIRLLKYLLMQYGNLNMDMNRANKMTPATKDTQISALHAAGHSRSMRNAGQVYYSSVTRATHLTEMGGLTVGILSNRF
ncbi:hypothetical protein V1520DRAFT_350830 [Lipomyces starkeyi]